MRIRHLFLFFILMLTAYACNRKEDQVITGVQPLQQINPADMQKNDTEPPIIVLSSDRPSPLIISLSGKAGADHKLKSKNGNHSNYKLTPSPVKIPTPVASCTIFGTEDGLPQTGISKSIKDRKGNLWFATQGAGVSCYDGKTFTNFNTSNGLAGNTIWCLCQDKDDNLWFGSDGAGVSRYDGKAFTNFNTNDGIENNSVLCIMCDRDGHVWLGTNGGGVSRFNAAGSGSNQGKAFTTLKTEHGLSDNHIRSMAQDKNGTFWFGTLNNGVCSYNEHLTGDIKKRFTCYTIKDGLPHNNIAYIFEDLTGVMWFGTEGGGISRFNPLALKTGADLFFNMGIKNGLASNIVWSIFQDSDSTIWFGCKGGGVSYLDGRIKNQFKDSLINFSVELGLTGKNITNINQDDAGKLWFGTNGNGIYRYNCKALKSYTSINGLADNIVWSCAEDHHGNMWFGNNGSGASMFDGKYITNYTTKSGLADDVVWCITEDAENKIWFGTLYGGASCFDGNSFITYNKEQGLAGNNVRCITQVKNGNIWFGTFGSGVSCFDGKSFTNYTTKQGLAGNTVRSIIEDDEGYLWFTSNEGGVCRFDQSSNPVNKKNPFTIYNTKQGLAGNTVFCITKDKSGMLWFGTDGGGVSRYDGKTFLNFTTKDGLADNVVYDSQEDKDGKIWFGTNLGFSVLSFIPAKAENANQKNLGAGTFQLTNDELRKYHPVWENFNQKTGYAIKDLNTNAMCIAKIGLPYDAEKGKEIIWGGCGDDKVVQLDPAAITYQLKTPELVIRKIKIKDENISWSSLLAGMSVKDSVLLSQQESILYGEVLSAEERKKFREKFNKINLTGVSPFYQLPQNLELPFRFNHITFEYNLIETGRHFMVNYQYKLAGQDDDWSAITKKDEITFNNLHEGDYTFYIRAQSPDAKWTEPVSYAFVILPPWYRTYWSYLIYLFSAFGFLYSFFRWRTNKLIKDKSLLEEKVILRTAEVVEQKEVAEKQRQRAEQSEKFKELFLANMSHEIRTPMHAVTGMTRLLLEKEPRHDQMRYLESIRNSSETLLVIINDILDLSKIEAGKIEIEKIDFSVYDVAKSLNEILKLKVEEKGLKLIIHIEENIPDVLTGDPTRLTQILVNLVGNAIKFTEKGTVQLVIHSKVQDVNRNAITDLPAESNIELFFSITDTGIGMTSEEQQKLFQNYIQANAETNRKYGGTGLGLSISKQLIELQGGTIEVKSKPGEGSTFSFSLIYQVSKKQKLIRREKVVSEKMLNQLTGIKILVADDNEYNRTVARETLQLKIKNVTVDEALDGEKTIEMFKTANYDIILMDLMMPKLNGFEATKIIRNASDSTKRNIPVVALTASLAKTEITKCNEAGMNGFIPKPFKLFELFDGIYQALNGKELLTIEEDLKEKKENQVKSSTVNLDYLYDVTEGDQVRMQRYIAMFIEKIPGYIDKINDAMVLKDFPSIQISVHSLKPLLSSICVAQAFKLAEEIEQSCTQNLNTDQLPFLIDELTEICNLAIMELKSGR